MDNQLILIPLIIVAFLIFFPALWSAISLLSSFLWGWNAMAQRYSGQIPEHEINNQFTWRSGRFGWGGYSGVLTFTVSDHDLGISVLFLYRAGHPPLRIPFSEITATEEIMLMREVHMAFDGIPDRKLKISKVLAEQIEQASNGNWTFERRDP
ncbi:MAG: hypothetical protein AAGD96_32415 [Chloroflexota bacterium]